MDRDHAVTEPVGNAVVERRAVVRSSLAFLVATAAAIGLSVVYIRGGQPQLEGALLAVTFCSIGVGLVTWAKHLMPQGPWVEQRETLPTTEVERDAFAEDFERAGVIGRRRMLVRLLGLAGAAVAAALVVPLRSLGPRPNSSSLHTNWRGGRRAVTSDGTAVLASEVPDNGLVTVFPEGDAGSANGQTVLLRVSTGVPVAVPGRESWTPDGLIAYSKVCTHAGCPVGLYQPDSHTLLCPCHQSAFDVLRAAVPISGPAAWPLPQLPLTIDADGYVASTGDFSAPVGPGWWKQ
jgi:ubiquinol-cytochrome c reductase iron-sulfur subunit